MEWFPSLGFNRAVSFPVSDLNAFGIDYIIPALELGFHLMRLNLKVRVFAAFFSRKPRSCWYVCCNLMMNWTERDPLIFHRRKRTFMVLRNDTLNTLWVKILHFLSDWKPHTTALQPMFMSYSLKLRLFTLLILMSWWSSKKKLIGDYVAFFHSWWFLLCRFTQLW